MAIIEIGHNVRHWTTWEIERDLTPEEEAVLAECDDGSVELIVELWRKGLLNYLKHEEDGADLMDPDAAVNAIEFDPERD